MRTTKLASFAALYCAFTIGKDIDAFGGPYALKGEKYEETIEYGVGEVFKMLKGKPQSFECKVEGAKWYHNGTVSNGLTIEEVWEMVEPK